MRLCVRSSSICAPDEVAGEEVAHDAERELGLLVHELGRGRPSRLRLDRLPEPLEEDEVALDVLRGRALGGGADDDAAALRVEVLDDVLEPRALLVLEPPRDAVALAVRDVDEEAARERELGREPRALRLHRVLDGLDEDRLAALDQVLDPARALAALELGADDLVDVQEPVLLEADLDERGLHPGKHVVDDAEVDVPGDRAPLRALEVDLGDAVVLEDRDALLADVDRDEQLALRGGQRRAPGRCAPAGRASAGLRSGLGLRSPCARACALASVAGCLARVSGCRLGARRRVASAAAPASRASSFRARRDFRGGASFSRPPERLVRASGASPSSACYLRRCSSSRAAVSCGAASSSLLSKAKPA